MKPIIEVEGISKSYKITHQSEGKAGYDTLKDDFAKLIKKPFGGTGEEQTELFWALKNVSFQVNPGETFGIIGKNGSGKSTMLKVLSRIVEPTEGKVTVHGRVASLLEVGTGFHPELTGRENVYFNGSMLGMSRQEIKRKFNDIVEFSEIEKFLDTPVKFYSSGMYVRLAFAVAAHLEPEVLILDEVLSVGDAQFQKKSMDKMLSIAKSGCTIIFVSHNMIAVEDLCERAMLLRKGKVVAIDKTEAVTDKYLVGDLSPAERQALIMTRKEQENAAEPKDTSEKAGAVKSKEEVNIGSSKKRSPFIPKDKVEYKDLTFEGFKLNDKSHLANMRVESGAPLEISVDYRSKKSSYINLGYGIRRKNDRSLVVFTHADLENFVYRTKGSGTIKAKLDLPRLAPDTYSLEFHLWVDGELVITEEKICEFIIPQIKAFASHQTFNNFPSSVVVDSHWSAVKN